MLSHAALEHLYDAYASGVVHYFMSFVKCEADAKDLLQELFLKLHARGLPESVESEKAYVWHLAHNLAIDWRRRKGAHDRAVESSAEEPRSLFADQANPDAAEFARRLEQALAELPTEQRSIAQLKLWDGLTFDEIAAVQGIPLNTAASRYRYAIDKLRTLLRPLYEEIKP